MGHDQPPPVICRSQTIRALFLGGSAERIDILTQASRQARIAHLKIDWQKS
jgi:hypothetical protein